MNFSERLNQQISNIGIGLIDLYKTRVGETGGVPYNSEFVKRCLIMYGVPAAFQAYHRINSRRADLQRKLLEVNLFNGREIPDGLKKPANQLLTKIFEFFITPVESVATLVGQGGEMQKLNNSLGAADWPQKKETINLGDGYYAIRNDDGTGLFIFGEGERIARPMGKEETDRYFDFEKN